MLYRTYANQVYRASPARKHVVRTIPTVEALERRELLSGGAVTQYLYDGDVPTDFVKGPDGNMWFLPLGGSFIDKVDSTGKVTAYPPTLSGYIGTFSSIVPGPDGNIWFTFANKNEIGKLNPIDGNFTTYTVTGTDATGEIISGPDGNMWFSFANGDILGKSTPAGQISYYYLGSDFPRSITAGPDGMIWFAGGSFKLDKLNPADGTIVSYTLPPDSPQLPVLTGGIASLAAGADGNMYASDPYGNQLYKVTPTGSVSVLPLPNGVEPSQLVPGSNGAIWFFDQQPAQPGVGREDTNGAVSQFLSLGLKLSPTLALDSQGNLWGGLLFPDAATGKSVIVKLSPDAFSNPTVTLTNATVGGVVQGVLSYATVGAGTPATPVSVQIAWQGGLPTDVAWMQLPGGGYSLNVPQVFGSAGSVPAQVTITDSNGVHTVIHTTLSVGPSPDGQFLVRVYHDLLGRGLDPAGSQAWLGALQHGSSRQQIVQGIQQSAEYRTQVIEQLYQSYLHRAADSFGLTTFMNLMSQGGSQAEIAARILGSQEYFQLKGDDNLPFLDALFADVLHRPADPAATPWIDLLNSGVSTTDVARGVLTSDEGRRAEVQSLYQLYLHRKVDGFGLQLFTQSLEQNGAEDQVINAIVSSPEYYGQPSGN